MLSLSFPALRRRWLALPAAVALLGGGAAVLFLRGTPPASATASTRTAGAPTLHHPFPFAATVRSVANRPARFAQGTRGTVVMAMATWCHFCAYDDRWVWPVIAKTPGVAIDLVNVSPYGGIARPGPRTPAFSGSDGTLARTSLAGMAATFRRYARIYGLTRDPNVHLYVAQTPTQTAWHVQAFPGIWLVNARGVTVSYTPGAITLAQARTMLRPILPKAGRTS